MDKKVDQTVDNNKDNVANENTVVKKENINVEVNKVSKSEALL